MTTPTRRRGTRMRVRKGVESTGEERAGVGHDARRTSGDRERWGPVGPTSPVCDRKIPHAPERGVGRPPRNGPPPLEHEV
eukprot:scaffold3801_cov124-Isochrysis_galbana.AAC.24